MPVSRAAVCAALLTVAGLTVAGCGDTRPTSSSSPRSAPSPPATGQPGFTVTIVLGGERFRAIIAGSAAGRDLIAQLPLTITMTEHGSVEKTGPLPAPLSTAGQPDGADPDVGDVGYYAPGNDFVLYHGDQSYHPGIVIIGRLAGDAAGRIVDLAGTVTATVEVHTG